MHIVIHKFESFLLCPPTRKPRMNSELENSQDPSQFPTVQNISLNLYPAFNNLLLAVFYIYKKFPKFQSLLKKPLSFQKSIKEVPLSYPLSFSSLLSFLPKTCTIPPFKTSIKLSSPHPNPSSLSSLPLFPLSFCSFFFSWVPTPLPSDLYSFSDHQSLSSSTLSIFQYLLLSFKGAWEMAEDLDDGEFWLPSEFLADDNFMEKKKVSGAGFENESRVCFPVDFSYGFGSYGSALSSPVESVVGSTETESDEEDYMAGLTRKMASSTLQDEDKTNSPGFSKVLGILLLRLSWFELFSTSLWWLWWV